MSYPTENTVDRTMLEFESVEVPRNIIMRLGSSSLLSDRVLLYSLFCLKEKVLSIKNSERRGIPEEELDYMYGPVSEFTVNDFRHFIKKKKSGQIYAEMRELLNSNAENDKSLYYQFASMAMDSSGHLQNLRLFKRIRLLSNERIPTVQIRFSDSNAIRNMLVNPTEPRVALPLSLMAGWKTRYTFRLYEILLSKIQEADRYCLERKLPQKETYTFRFQLGHLELLLGVFDLNRYSGTVINTDRVDYNAIAYRLNEEDPQPLFKYYSFNFNVLKKAEQEINEEANSLFSVSHIEERKARTNQGSLLTEVIFTCERKHTSREFGLSEGERMQFLIDLARETVRTDLNYEQLLKLSRASGYSMMKLRTVLLRVPSAHSAEELCSRLLAELSVSTLK